MLFLFFLLKKKNRNHHVSDVEWCIKATRCMCKEKYTLFGKRKSILLTLELHSKWRHIWHVGFGETLLLFRRRKSKLILQGWDHVTCTRFAIYTEIDWLSHQAGPRNKGGPFQWALSQTDMRGAAKRFRDSSIVSPPAKLSQRSAFPDFEQQNVATSADVNCSQCPQTVPCKTNASRHGGFSSDLTWRINFF